MRKIHTFFLCVLLLINIDSFAQAPNPPSNDLFPYILLAIVLIPLIIIAFKRKFFSKPLVIEIDKKQIGIICGVLGLALFLFAQTMNTYDTNGSDEMYGINKTKKIVQYIGISFLVFGGIFFALGMSQKKK